MKKLRSVLCIAFILSILLACSHHSVGDYTPFTNPATEQAQQQFEQQKQLILKQDSNSDFNLLRQSYAKTTHFEPWDSTEHQAGLALLDAQAKENFSLCLQLAEAMLERNFTSPLGHFGVYSCGQHSEHPKADLHFWIARNLLLSIEQSGDGSTVEQAYICNSATEMRDFIRLKGWRMIRAEMVNSGFRQIDRVFVLDKQEELVELYFDTTAARLSSFGLP